MAMTYASLIAAKNVATLDSIMAWGNYGLLPLDAIITEAQTRIFSELRSREMKISAVLTLAVGASSFPLPAGFLDPISVRVGPTKDRVQLIDPDQLEDQRILDSSGNLMACQPAWCCISDEQIQFDTQADQQYFVYLRYFGMAPANFVGMPPDGSSTTPNQSNFLTVRYPDLMRLSCLRQVASFMKDWDSFDRYESQLSAALQRVAVNDDLSIATEQVPVEND